MSGIHKLSVAQECALELLEMLGPTPRTLELEPRRERRGVMANTLLGLNRRGYASVCRCAWAITLAGVEALVRDEP